MTRLMKKWSSIIKDAQLDVRQSLYRTCRADRAESTSVEWRLKRPSCCFAAPAPRRGQSQELWRRASLHERQSWREPALVKDLDGADCDESGWIALRFQPVGSLRSSATEDPQSHSGLAGAAYGKRPTRTRTRSAMIGAAFRRKATGRVTPANPSSAPGRAVPAAPAPASARAPERRRRSARSSLPASG